MSDSTKEPTDEIHIYTDGAWLDAGSSKNQKNTVKTGGCGIVVLCNGQIEEISQPASDWCKNSADAEWNAIQKALDYITHRLSGQKPNITLHIDEQGIYTRIKATNHLSLAPADERPKTQPRTKPQEIIDRISELKIDVVISKDPKLSAQHPGFKSRDSAINSPHMTTAHDLAKRAAWADRLRRQDGTVWLGNGYYSGADALRIIDGMGSSNGRER